MSWTYSCPWCDAMLNPDQTIILVGSQDKNRMLIGFHPEPGNYELFLPPEVTIGEGDHWDFFCPVCRENLVAGELEDLCELKMLDGADQHRVYFSRISGERATLVVSEAKVEAHHGEHVEKYVRRVAPVRY